jgi:hypothetical protein
MTAAVLLSTIRAHGAVGVALISPRRDAALSPVGGQRTLLVVGNDAELAVALRDRLDRAYLTVFEVRPDEASEAVHACRPWPWMVVGATPEIPEPLRHALASHPVVLIWRAPPPPRMPPHLRAVQRFSELAGAVAEVLRVEVGGIRLAVGSGLTMPDGVHASSPVLEALVTNHPRPVRLSARQIRSAAAALAAHGVPLRPRPADGGAVLVPAEVR